MSNHDDLYCSVLAKFGNSLNSFPMLQTFNILANRVLCRNVNFMIFAVW